MNGAKLAGLVVIGILLFTTVGAANVATTADRTVLNGEYVSQTVEEEGAYDSIRNETIERVLERMQAANLSQGQTLLQAGEGTDNRTLVENAVTENYVRDETSENIEELFAYLNGDREELFMDLDLRPLKNNLAEEFGDQVEQKNTSALVEAFGPDEGESPVPVNASLVEKMKSGPEGYQEARLDFRVDVAFAATTTDQKLLLIGENPRGKSEQEKERIVEQREDEIRSELRTRLADNPDTITIEGERIEVGEEVDQRRTQAKADACDRTREELNSSASDAAVCNGYTGGVSNAPPKDNMTQAAVAFQYVIIDGLSEEGYSYDAFSADLQSSEDALSTETADLADARIQQQVPNTLSAEEQFGESTVNDLRNARSAVGAVGLASLLLPFVALVLVGLAYALTRSVETTAKTTGIVLLLVGGLSALVATLGRGAVLGAVEERLSSGGASEFASVAVALVEGVLATLAAQSIGLFVLGVVLVALVAANRRGLLDDVKTKAGIGAAGASEQPAGQEEPPSHQPEQQQAPPQGGSPGQEGDRGGQQTGQSGGEQGGTTGQEGGGSGHSGGGQAGGGHSGGNAGSGGRGGN